MTYFVFKGWHFFMPPIFNFFRGSNLKRKVKFHPSCRYNLDNNDQYDVNKLFGFGYGLEHHHKNSARFGWRYEPTIDKIILYAYVYHNKYRLITRLAELEFNKEYELAININGNAYFFSLDGKQIYNLGGVTPKRTKRELGAYFGGNQTAPHPMKITLKKH